MARIGPIKRCDLIKNLRALGFDGPHVAKGHEVMLRGLLKVRVPNSHEGDISQDLLDRILRGAGIKDEWLSLP